VIRPAYPDFDLIRGLVQEALTTPPAPTPSPSGTPGTDSSGGAAAPSTGASGFGDEAVEATPSPVTNAADACAYDPVVAQEALDEGEPPTR
jgi:hypothetical protein